MNSKFMNQFINDESGQGITEYGAILAFVALLIAMLFSQKEALFQSISKAFNAVVLQLNSIST